jgi:hypothetical protein
MEAALRKGECLDLGCAAAHRCCRHGKGGYQITEGDQPAAAFLFELIAKLQTMVTVQFAPAPNGPKSSDAQALGRPGGARGPCPS